MEEEYTNPSEMEFDDGENLFTEDEPTSEAEVKEEQPEQEDAKPDQPEQEEAPAKEEGQKVKIKYNHEEKEISLDEAITLAQKGMNYDKLQGELDKLKNSRERQLLEGYAEASGLSYEEYIGHLEKQRDAAIVQNEISDIKAKYPDMPDTAVREMAELRSKSKRADLDRAKADKERAKKEADMKPWMDFAKRYPDRSELTPEEVKLVQEGRTPIEARLEYEQKKKDDEIAELKRKLETQDKNKKNKEKSIGSVQSTADDSPVDAFLQGLSG